jgi:predicted O-linked N-acetylglucosamine transferase (SPINDLY family)
LAVASYRAATYLRPDDALGHSNLGNALLKSQDFPAAESSYREAIRLRPSAFELYNNLGVTLREQHRWADAKECFAQALKRKPDCAEAESNLGNVLCDEGDDPTAILAYRRALALNESYAPAHFNLGNALKRTGQLVEALAEYRRAVELDPADASAHTNLGVTLCRFDKIDEAVDACRRAVELDANFALAHNNLASCLHIRGEVEEALPHYRRAATLKPADSLLQSNLAHALLYAPSVSPREIFDQHRLWGARHADPLPRANIGASDRAADRRLRVGYVSAHFREHAIAVFAEGLLTNHDHTAFEIFCYSDVRSPDRATERIRSSADRWIDITRHSDAALADRVVSDCIDILVDLTGHLEGNRLLAFARKPAPIQVTYLGYQATTGMEAMDYRFTDEWSDPAGATESLHTEELVRLPGAFFCYRPLDESPEVNELPADVAGSVTFGSFNKLAKITRDVLDAWGRILASAEESRLIILAEPSDHAFGRIRAELARHGVAPDRVVFVAKQPREGYLRLHHRVDIVLDTFPFNGHTTVCEALWMGVPAIALSGKTYVERFGGSALFTLGMTSPKAVRNILK